MIKAMQLEYREVEAVDVAKILNSVPPTQDVVVLGNNSPRVYERRYVVFIRVEFLARFEHNDSVFVAGENIYPKWGSNSHVYCALGSKSSASFMYSNSPPKIEGWRSRIVNSEDFEMLTTQVALARSYQRVVNVDVFYL